MKTLILTSLILITPFVLPAQSTGVIQPAPGPDYSAVKQYLGLSDAQLQSLLSIQDAQNQAQQKIYAQIGEKNTQIRQLLDSGAPPALQIGQLMIEVRNLEKQLGFDSARGLEAWNVLNADQKLKLAQLNGALQLQSAAWQAVALLLLVPTADGGMPRPVDFGGGPATGAAGAFLGAPKHVIRK